MNSRNKWYMAALSFAIRQMSTTKAMKEKKRKERKLERQNRRRGRR